MHEMNRAILPHPDDDCWLCGHLYGNPGLASAFRFIISTYVGEDFFHNKLLPNDFTLFLYFCLADWTTEKNTVDVCV